MAKADNNNNRQQEETIMKKYIVTLDNIEFEKTYISTSRDAKKFCREYGANVCQIYTRAGKLGSQARRDENGKIYSCYVA